MSKITKAILTVLVACVGLVGGAHAAPPAQVGQAWCVANQAGGRIVFTMTPSPKTNKWFIVFSSMGGGQTIYGEWTLVGKSTIMVSWGDGGSSMFPINRLVGCEF